MSIRLDNVMAAMDAVNAKDPMAIEAEVEMLPRGLVYGKRMSAAVTFLTGPPDDASLGIAPFRV